MNGMLYPQEEEPRDEELDDYYESTYQELQYDTINEEQ